MMLGLEGRILSVNRVKGNVWWCPNCDNASLLSVKTCVKCGGRLADIPPSATVEAKEVFTAPPLTSEAPVRLVIPPDASLGEIEAAVDKLPTTAITVAGTFDLPRKPVPKGGHKMEVVLLPLEPHPSTPKKARKGKGQ